MRARTVPALVAALALVVPGAFAQEPGELHPPLFTAAAVRDATKVGHRHRHRVEQPGKPAELRTTEVVSVTEHGAVTRITTTDEAGKELAPPETREITWVELERRSALPKAMTLRQRTLDLPAGRFPCTVAEAQLGGQVQRLAFSSRLPGVVIQMETLLVRATLIEVHPALAAPKDEPPAGDLLPPPFSADRIREATKPGRTYRFRSVQGDKATESRMEFVAVDAEGATLRRATLDAAAKEPASERGPAREERVTWKELEAHAVFPRALTTVSEADVTVPAGTFRCRIYDVVEGTRAARFCFALDLPGAPVEMTIWLRDPADPKKPGALLQRMQLVEHTPGT